VATSDTNTPPASTASLLVWEPIDTARLLASVANDAAGANVLFTGTTRGVTAGVLTTQITKRLTYEAHEPLASAVLARLRDEAVAQYGLTACAIIHRLGEVAVGETSVAIATSAPHRREAFAAAEWLMEQIKREAPIWKCEEGADGDRTWVHPDSGLHPESGQHPDSGPHPASESRSEPRPALVDSFGRIHTDLRISVTDRCNLRCTYCMPLDVAFKPREELLSYEEIVRVARVAAGLGIRSIRITGGEPLVRREVAELVRQLVTISGIEEVSLTTNGLLLEEQAADLRRAGLHRLNVSLDALNEDAFERIARRQGLARVLAGLAAAKAAGFRSIRINAVSIRGLTEGEIVPLAEFCRREGFHLRFIEFMPLDGESSWSDGQVLSGREVRDMLARHFGPLVPTVRSDAGQPAIDYSYADHDCANGAMDAVGLPTQAAGVGFIDPVTQPFCDRCDRLRLTADGQFRNCLFSTTEWDARHALRTGGSDDEIARLLRDCVLAKRAAHGIGTPAFERPARAMYQIGG
jgi:cyclic pyranopterin phosphate synthase